MSSDNWTDPVDPVAGAIVRADHITYVTQNVQALKNGLVGDGSADSAIVHQHASGALSALPAPGNAGRAYVCTDLRIILYDDGSEWLIPTSGTHLSMCEYNDMSAVPPGSVGTDRSAWFGKVTGTATISGSGGNDNTVWKLNTGTTTGSVAAVGADDTDNHNFFTDRKFILMVRVRDAGGTNQIAWGGLAREANTDTPADFIGVFKTDAGNWFAKTRTTAGAETSSNDLGATNFAMAIFCYDGTDLKIYKNTFNAAGLLETITVDADIPQLQMTGRFRLKTSAGSNDVSFSPDTFLLHMESS